MEEDLRRLAVLDLGGPISFDSECRLPIRVSHSISTTGSVIIAFGDHKAVMDVSDADPEFILRPASDGRFEVRRHGSRFIRSVRVEPLVRVDSEHSVFLLEPDDRNAHAAIVVGGGCLDDALKAFNEYSEIYNIVYLELFGDSSDDLTDFLKTVRNRRPDIFMNARTDLVSADDAARLRNSGADRIEVDLVTSDDRYDPRDRIQLLHDAAERVGAGVIVARISIGLRETTADLDILMESLCRMGVVPEITVDDRVCDINPEKLAMLHEIRAARMRKHGLDPDTVI